MTFRKGFTLFIEKGAYVEIGDNTFFNNNCSIIARKEIIIGKNCLFGEDVNIYDHNHIFKYKDFLIKNQGYNESSIKIGDNCWIGSKSIILKGTCLYDNVVISAGEKVKGEKMGPNQLLENGKISDIRLEVKDA